MRITRRQLRRIVQEKLQLSESTLYVQKLPYGGVDIEDEAGKYIGVGEMIRDLSSQYVGGDGWPKDWNQSAAHYEKLMTADRQAVQGVMESWDSDVFTDYYGVDLDALIRVYADAGGYKLEEVPTEEW